MVQFANDEQDGDAWLVLKEHMWSTMVWPLRRLDSGHFEMDIHGQATWLHVYNLDDFVAVPSVWAWHKERFGLCVLQTDDSMPILKYALAYKPSAFIYNSLLILGQHMGVCTGSEKPNRKSLLERLAETQGDSDYVSSVLEADKKKSTQTVSEGDANLVECLYEQLDLEERTEYRELKQKMDQSKTRNKQWKWQQWLSEKNGETKKKGGRKPKAKAKPKPKPKGRPKGKAKSSGKSPQKRKKSELDDELKDDDSHDSGGGSSAIDDAGLDASADQGEPAGPEMQHNEEAPQSVDVEMRVLDPAQVEEERLPPIPEAPGQNASETSQPDPEGPPPPPPPESPPPEPAAALPPADLPHVEVESPHPNLVENPGAPLNAAAAEPPCPPERPSSSRASASGWTRENVTPPVLLELEPNDRFKFFLQFNDWRFKLECKHQSDRFLPPYHCKTFSRCFASTKDWKGCLEAVHKYCWEKYDLVSDQLALKPGQHHQTPGEIPDAVLRELQPVMEGMAPPTDYNRRRR